ncbi:hypothetical protein M3231_18465 [Neobacillus mesonae]|nr:hypothetical protein [Neobacillus mesonae]
MSNIHIKIHSVDQPAKLIPLLRKYTALGISEIKNRIGSGQSVFTFNALDEDECEIANKIIMGIPALGGEVKLFDDDEELTLDLYWNLQQQREETSKYLQDIVDLQNTKILISLDEKFLGMIGDTCTVFSTLGNDIILESEMNNRLMDLLQTIVDDQVPAKVYQVEQYEEGFDEDDEVSPNEILAQYKSYFD